MKSDGIRPFIFRTEIYVWSSGVFTPMRDDR